MRKEIVWKTFELGWGVPESEISHFLVFQLFLQSIIIFICEMGERTPDGAVWVAFLYPRKMAELHSIVRELRMPLFNRDDLVQMSFTQSFVIVLEVVAGDDVRISELPVSSVSFS